MKKGLTFLLIGIMVFFIFSCKSEGSICILPTKDGGRTMIISLMENKTTGFSWEYEQLTGEEYGEISLSKDEIILPDDLSLIGAPSTREYYFVGVKPGKQTLTLIYRRPWQGGETAYKLIYDLSIDSNLNIKYYRKKFEAVDYDKNENDFSEPRFE